MNLYEKPPGAKTRWSSFENLGADRNRGGLENRGAKGHAFDHIRAGETVTLLDIEGSGTITRIWLTIGDRSPRMLRSLRIDMFWDGAASPAVSAPIGDFFGVGLGRRLAFECALFSDPEGRSFNCFIPMPFRTSARIQITNDSPHDILHLFYDVDLLTGIDHSDDALYFHTHWRRERPNRLGEEYAILPRVTGAGRFLGSNVGIIADPAYEGAWWGEGEVKARFGDDEHPTLCGTGAEDYVGTAWGLGHFINRTQGCTIAERDTDFWAFYRYHLDDPIFFDEACSVAIQTIGGTETHKVLSMQERGVPLIPVSVDPGEVGGFVKLLEPNPREIRDPLLERKWTNFWRQDDWSSTAYFYLDAPENNLSPLASIEERIAGLGE